MKERRVEQTNVETSGVLPEKVDVREETAAKDVLHMLNNCAERAEKISEDLSYLLAPVMNPSTPKSEETGSSQMYPSYFQSIYKVILRLNGAMNDIDDIMNRTEL